MMRRRRQHQPLQVGIVMLLYQVLANVGLSNIPPVTLSALALQVGLFLRYFDPGWGPISSICLSANHVVNRGEYYRIFTSAVEHGHDMHLYYNMVSFIWKGKELERRWGSLNMALLLAFLTGLTGIMYVILALVATEFFQDFHYMDQCAIGFSGVLFALKVIANDEIRHPEERKKTIFGFHLPLKVAVWAELFLIQLFAPDASFIGHLAGILSGLVYVYARSTLTLASSPVFVIWNFPATAFLSTLFCAIQFDWIDKPWTTRHLWNSGTSLVCLSSKLILEKNSWIRLISGPLEHTSDIHFAMCLISFILKSYQLECKKGTISTVFSVIFSILGSGLMFVVASYLRYKITQDYQHYMLCVQGLSGSLFALKIICLGNTESFLSPTCLFEIFEILMLLEDRTFLNHVSGIVMGLIMLGIGRSPKFPGSGRRLGDGEAWFQERREPWTRSWGYANFDQPIIIPSHNQGNSQDYRSMSSGDSFEFPAGASSERSFNNASYQQTESQNDRRRSQRSPTPSPSAPPYDPTWDRNGNAGVDPPYPIYPSEFPYQPPPQGSEGQRLSQSSMSSNEDFDLNELRRRRMQRFT